LTAASDEAKVMETHNRYYQALSNGNMDALADNFTFPAAFKGFLDDVVVATNKESLLTIYEELIAAAPKATRTELRATEVSYLRPGVYMVTMSYEQYGEDDESIHEGSAMYFLKQVVDDYKLFAVF
jgi:hypothetical protein